MGSRPAIIFILFLGAMVGIAFMYGSRKRDVQGQWIRAYAWLTDQTKVRLKDNAVFETLCKCGLEKGTANETLRRLIHWLKVERKNILDGLENLEGP